MMISFPTRLFQKNKAVDLQNQKRNRDELFEWDDAFFSGTLFFVKLIFFKDAPIDFLML